MASKSYKTKRRQRKTRKTRKMRGGLEIYKINKPVWTPKPKKNLTAIPSQPIVQEVVVSSPTPSSPTPYTATYSFAKGTPERVNTV